MSENDSDSETSDDGIARPWEDDDPALETDRCDCDDDPVKIGVGCEDDGAPFVTYECPACLSTWDQYEHWSFDPTEETNHES